MDSEVLQRNINYIDFQFVEMYALQTILNMNIYLHKFKILL